MLAGAGALAVALASGTRASEFIVDRVTGEVNIFNTIDQRLTGSLELVDSLDHRLPVPGVRPVAPQCRRR